jgi:hypothetical protein
MGSNAKPPAVADGFAVSPRPPHRTAQRVSLLTLSQLHQVRTGEASG